jgi:hypothetical protein
MAMGPGGTLRIGPGVFSPGRHRAKDFELVAELTGQAIGRR